MSTSTVSTKSICAARIDKGISVKSRAVTKPSTSRKFPEMPAGPSGLHRTCMLRSMSLGSAVKKSTTLLLVSSISQTDRLGIAELPSAGATMSGSAVVSNRTSGVPPAVDTRFRESSVASTPNPFSTSSRRDARLISSPDVVKRSSNRDKVTASSSRLMPAEPKSPSTQSNAIPVNPKASDRDSPSMASWLGLLMTVNVYSASTRLTASPVLSGSSAQPVRSWVAEKDPSVNRKEFQFNEYGAPSGSTRPGMVQLPDKSSPMVVVRSKERVPADSSIRSRRTSSGSTTSSWADAASEKVMDCPGGSKFRAKASSAPRVTDSAEA